VNAKLYVETLLPELVQDCRSCHLASSFSRTARVHSAHTAKLDCYQLQWIIIILIFPNCAHRILFFLFFWLWKVFLKYSLGYLWHFNNIRLIIIIILITIGWLRGTVVGLWPANFPCLRSACSCRVTTAVRYIPVGQPTRPTQPSILSGLINEQ